MITVSQAEALVLKAAKLLPAEVCSLKQAGGRVLREDIHADRDQPAFDKATMDGIAFAYSAWAKGRREFEVEGMAAAGDAPKRLKDSSHCLQIMTGAVVPQGCDCLAPVEYVRFSGKTAVLKDGGVFKADEFIRARGADAKKGDLILKAGVRLMPPQVGIAASFGKKSVKVSRRPSIAIIATGNELVDVGRPLKVHQTRLSNSYALESLFVQSGLATAQMFHLPDDPKILESRIRHILKTFDILVLSGGVSMGELDYVPAILNKLKIRNIFHKVAQRPGKPLWFGKSAKGQAVFGLPGNPNSTLICAYRYVVPFLAKCAGLRFKKQTVTLTQKETLKSGLTLFFAVKDGAVVHTGGSGNFAGLADTDGFIEYDNTQNGPQRPYFSWRPQ